MNKDSETQQCDQWRGDDSIRDCVYRAKKVAVMQKGRNLEGKHIESWYKVDSEQWESDGHIQHLLLHIQILKHSM